MRIRTPRANLTQRLQHDHVELLHFPHCQSIHTSAHTCRDIQSSNTHHGIGSSFLFSEKTNQNTITGFIGTLDQLIYGITTQILTSLKQTLTGSKVHRCASLSLGPYRRVSPLGWSDRPTERAINGTRAFTTSSHLTLHMITGYVTLTHYLYRLTDTRTHTYVK